MRLGIGLLCMPMFWAFTCFASSIRKTGQQQKILAAQRSVRGIHTATSLLDGRILFINLDGAKLYNPTSHVWSDATNGLQNKFMLHTATLLPNGCVLVVGGIVKKGTSCEMQSSLLIYNPYFSNWRSIGNVIHPRIGHTANLLENNRIVLVGGYSIECDKSAYKEKDVTNTELCDIETGTCTEGRTHAEGRSLHAAVTLPTGKILILGGHSVMGHGGYPSGEIYDPTLDVWSSTDGPPIGKDGMTVTVLANGNIVALGSVLDPVSEVGLFAIYDSKAHTWNTTQIQNVPVGDHTATLLPDGRIFITGGRASKYSTRFPRTSVTSTSLLFDPLIDRWNISKSLPQPRAMHTATLLSPYAILIAGGVDEKGHGLKDVVVLRIPVRD